ncbi:AMP-binding protein [Evansella sp. AB-rgal1]|uniref:AMP-binding protein n=1 Tax=Evansella sp. AB-rgal1 TaxID=3242696 RepID=UPI00359D1E04
MMKIVRLMYVLFKIQLLSPLSIYRLFAALVKNGINIMVLLHFSAMKFRKNIALVDDRETLTYHELYEQSMQLAVWLKEKHQLGSGHKVAFLCKNHASLVKAIFAVSRLGADIYFLHTETSKDQFNNMVQQHQFHLIIHDAEASTLLEQSQYKNARLLTYHDSLPAINTIVPNHKTAIPRTSSSKLILQTSGTTGASKAAAHKPSLFNYLHPFLAFFNRLSIEKYNTAYIATPIYHGYGIAVLLLFMPLGKKSVISTGFDAKKACNLIQQHQVEVVTVVPLMLQKMLQADPQSLKSLACIASGGAKLSTKLIQETSQQLGNVLYNLYGTSEAGLNFIATPEDLQSAPTTIGKKIDGMQIAVLDGNKCEVKNGVVGQLSIKNDWSISNRKHSWIQTGDLGYQDEHGYFFLCGRTDDMIISGGENVYPIEVEQILIKHPSIEDVAVIGIEDEQFGERLKAFVLPKQGAELSTEELFAWIKPRVARRQLPKEMKIVKNMPYTPLGKLDKKALSKYSI